MTAAAADEPANPRGWRFADFVAVTVGALIVYAVVAFFVVTDRQRIAALLDEGEAAIERLDAAACLAMLEPEVRLLSPGGMQEEVSAEVVRRILQESFKSYSKVHIDLRKREIIVAEGTARVNFRGQLQIESQDVRLVGRQNIRGTLSLRKTAPETWKITRIEILENRGVN